MVFVTGTQFTSALVLLVRSEAALANQTAASKTLVKSLNSEGLLLWLHCYDNDAESLIMVINVIKIKKNNFEYFGDLTAFALVDVFVYQNISETSMERPLDEESLPFDKSSTRSPLK